MAIVEELTLNRTQNQEIQVKCTKCAGNTWHKVVVSADVDGHEGEDDGRVDWEENYQILRCGGCRTLSYRTVTAHSEDGDYGEDGWEQYERVEIYPLRDKDRKQIAGVHFLPNKVQIIYQETLQALVDAQPVLTGIGIRAIIETVCKDKAAEGRDLYSQIDDLRAKGMLTEEGKDILHKLRVLGNKAAHEVEPHPADQLSLALEVVEHLLQGAYIHPARVARTFR